MKEPFNEGSFFCLNNTTLPFFLKKNAKHSFPRHKQTYLYNLYPKHITPGNLFFANLI